MFGRLQSKMDHALARVRRAAPLTHIEVQACLRDLRVLLLEIEVRGSDVDACFDRLLAEIADSKAMLLSDAGARVAVLIHRALMSDSAVGGAITNLDREMPPMPATKSSASRWDFKELDNQLGKKNESSTAFRFVRPTPERNPSKRLDLRHRTPFVDGAKPEDTDTRYRNLDRATVDRFVRDLGKGFPDFGPEPPTGGQPARI